MNYAGLSKCCPWMVMTITSGCSASLSALSVNIPMNSFKVWKI